MARPPRDNWIDWQIPAKGAGVVATLHHVLSVYASASMCLPMCVLIVGALIADAFCAKIYTIHLFKRHEKSILYFSIIIRSPEGPD